MSIKLKKKKNSGNSKSLLPDCYRWTILKWEEIHSSVIWCQGNLVLELDLWNFALAIIFDKETFLLELSAKLFFDLLVRLEP